MQDAILTDRSKNSKNDCRGTAKSIFLSLSTIEPGEDFLRTLEAGLPEWAAAARLSIAHRTFPVFLRNLRMLRLESNLPADTLALLDEAARRSAAYTTMLMTLADRILRMFARSGIRAIPLKGASLARYYPEPALRPMRDIDLFIEQRDFPACRSLLEDAGYYPADPVKNGVFVNPGQECLFRGEDGVEIDLHYRFFPWFEEKMVYGFASSDLTERAVPFEETAGASAGLLPEDELYYLLLTLHRSRMDSFWHWTDIEALVRSTEGCLQWGRLAELIRQSPLQKELTDLVRRAEDITRLPLLRPLGIERGGPAACAAPEERAVLAPKKRSRWSDKAFVWNSVKDSRNKIRLAGLFFGWQLFKTTGIFKRKFLSTHNPAGEEIGRKRDAACSNSGRWRLNTERFFRHEAAEDQTIVDLRSGESFTIGGAGGSMFRGLMKGEDTADIVRQTLEQYEGTTPKAVRNDLDGLIRRLEKTHIIRRRANDS